MPIQNASYEPLQHPNDIRLLAVLPGNDDKPIHCMHLGLTNLDEEYPSAESLNANNSRRLRLDRKKARPYIAISYAWGINQHTEPIFIDGAPVSITVNLFSFLKMHRRMINQILADKSDLGTVAIWIDALCIDQSNINEREAQVKLMDRVYQHATSVFIYIGESSEGQQFDALLDQIIDAGHKLKSVPKTPQLSSSAATPIASQQNTCEERGYVEPLGLNISQRKMQDSTIPCLEDFGMPPAYDEIWRLWVAFFSFPWFQRLWVIQEFAFARHRSFLYGESDIPVFKVMRAYGLLCQFGFAPISSYGLRLDVSEQGVSPFQRGANCLDTLAGASLRNGIIPNDPKPKLIKIIGRTTQHQCSDARDYLYALINLSSEKNLYAPLISYTEPPATVFRKFATMFVEHGDGIELLFQAATSSICNELPSWVPNWSGDRINFTRIAPHDEINDFTASRATTARMTVDVAEARLELHAIICDKIIEQSIYLGQRVGNVGKDGTCSGNIGHRFTAEDVLFFLMLGHMLAGRLPACSTKEAQNEVLFRTLARMPQRPETDISEMKDGFEAFTDLVDKLSEHKANNEATMSARQDHGDTGNQADNQSDALGHYDAETTAHMNVERQKWGEDRKRVDIRMAHMLKGRGSVCKQRRLCITERGYFGLIPSKAEVGDRVVIFHGAPVPFLIRDTQQMYDGKPAYKLVGDGYFYELMHGQAFDLDGCDEGEILLV